MRLSEWGSRELKKSGVDSTDKKVSLSDGWDVWIPAEQQTLKIKPQY